MMKNLAPKIILHEIAIIVTALFSSPLIAGLMMNWLNPSGAISLDVYGKVLASVMSVMFVLGNVIIYILFELYRQRKCKSAIEKILKMEVKIVLSVVLISSFAFILHVYVCSLTPPHEVESFQSCYASLKIIAGAKDVWATDNHKTNGAEVTENDLLPYISKMPPCSRGGVYTIGKVGELPKCSVAEHA